MSSPRPSFDRFQAEVLTALADADAPAEVVETARRHAPDGEVAAWVDAWDPDLVALAGELVRTWGRRSPEG